jgi:hypothetical protein
MNPPLQNDYLLVIYKINQSMTFPPLLSQFGLGSAYGLYTTAAAISFFFVWFFIRETKGLELEEM